jgi:hypothetical protein
MAIPEKDIQKTMEILTDWNPLGSKAKTIKDLDNYRTEAKDILFNIELGRDKAAVIVRRVLNQAFDIALSLDECTAVGNKIQELIKDKNRF